MSHFCVTFCVAAHVADSAKIGSTVNVTCPGAIAVGRAIDGRFPLLEQLGETEWSSAWLTELDDGRQQKAAIKIFPFESIDPHVTITRWELAQTLSHPHLMPLFYAGRCELGGEDLLYVVTEYADETLSQILPDRPLSPREAREMLGPVLGALSYLHQRSLTHGHLRPTNIMVIDDQLKLSPDFGWRARTRGISDPPEAGSGDAAPAADIWSLGILLVEALTQQPPVWDRSQGSEPEIPAAIPEPFFTICRECLRTDPKLRCSLGRIKALLNPPPAAEPAVKPAEPFAAKSVPAGAVVTRAAIAGAAATGAVSAEPIPAAAFVARAAKPHSFRVKILAVAIIFVALTIAAFKFGWDLTPSSPTPAPRPSAPELTAAPTAAPEPVADTAPAPHPAPSAPIAPAPSAVPVAKEAAAPSANQAAAPVIPTAIRPAPSGEPIAEPAPAPAAQPNKAGAVKGSVAHQALPDIPAKIANTIQGHIKVTIRAQVDPDGSVSQASIDSPGPSRYFANQALHAAQNFKFAPPQVHGHPVASTWLLQFQFGPSQIEVTPTEEGP